MAHAQSKLIPCLDTELFFKRYMILVSKYAKPLLVIRGIGYNTRRMVSFEMLRLQATFMNTLSRICCPALAKSLTMHVFRGQAPKNSGEKKVFELCDLMLKELTRHVWDFGWGFRAAFFAAQKSSDDVRQGFFKGYLQTQCGKAFVRDLVRISHYFWPPFCDWYLAFRTFLKVRNCSCKGVKMPSFRWGLGGDLVEKNHFWPPYRNSLGL